MSRSTWPVCSPPTGAGSAPRRAPARWDRSATRYWYCAGSAIAPACTAWPAMPGSPKPPATGICMRASTLSPTGPNAPSGTGPLPERGMGHLILDGTLIGWDRAAGVRENGNDLWYPGKARRFSGNIQFLAAPDGPLWVSGVEPGSPPTSPPPASTPCRPRTKRRAMTCPPWPTSATRAPASACTPSPRVHPNRPGPLHPDNRLLRGLGERAATTLKRLRALQHVTLSPNRIGAIAQAALVLNPNWN